MTERSQEVLGQPERLSDEVVGNLLSGVGNHEAKAILLVAMQTGQVYSRPDSFTLITAAQGPNPGWVMDSKGPFGYFQNSLDPVSLVAMEIIDSSLKTYGYLRTEHGETLGVPLCGLLLDFSIRHSNYSLQDLLGGTNSANARTSTITMAGEEAEYKLRSPINRFKIFKQLIKAPRLPLRVEDLQDAGLSQVTDHLRTLSKAGIINYESTRHGQSLIFLSLASDRSSDDPSPYHDRTQMTQAVYRLLLSKGDKVWTIQELVDELVKTYHKGNYNGVSAICTHLRKNGYLKAQKFTREQASEIGLDDEQRQLLTDFVNIVDIFQNQNLEVLERGRRLASQILANPVHVSILMRKAKEHSTQTNKRPLTLTLSNIYNIIEIKPSITTIDILEMLSTRYGYRLSRTRIGRLINKLKNNGSIISKIVKGNNTWHTV